MVKNTLTMQIYHGKGAPNHRKRRDSFARLSVQLAKSFIFCNIPNKSEDHLWMPPSLKNNSQI